MRTWRMTGLAALATAAVLLWSPAAQGFSSYQGGCVTCHPGFEGGFDAALHQLHVGPSQMTATCTRCHTNAGDDPSTSNCAGCHMGVGLRTHHRAAAVSDCGDTSCHASDGTPPDESVIPPYYGQPDINIDHPCFVDPLGATRGEDFDGDLKGLDNDGDLAYDFDDPDCEGLPITESSWGQIKSLF